MKATWVGHACVLVETAQAKCLTDPWLSDPILGSMYHEPPRAHRLEDLPAPDVVCITHCHFDHFHDETLKRIDKKARILIPKSPLRNIRAELQTLGFTDIHELKPWQTHAFRDLKITAIPSVGVPEEVAYVIEGEGQAIFNAADCFFEKIAAQIGERFKIDVGFISYCGWDYSGMMGVQPEKKWKPDYDGLVKACLDLKIKYLVPAAWNVMWFPEELRWLNERVCPGKMEEFLESLERVGQGRIIPLRMNPGDQWLGEGDRIRPGPGTKVKPDLPRDWMYWLKDPRLKRYTLDELTEEIRKFIRRRRRHFLKVFFRSPKIAYFLLTCHFEAATIYEGKVVVWEIDLRKWNPVKLGEHQPRVQFGVSVTWEDACALIQGIVDSQELANSARFKLVYLPKRENFVRIFGMEFIFFTRSLARLAAA